MKRFLTFILAIAMIATLIPSAFAVETDGEEKITVTCDVQNLTIEKEMYGGGSDVNNGCQIPLSDIANDTYKYVRSSVTNPDQQLDLVTEDKTLANKITYRGATPNPNYLDPSNGYIILFNRNWISFEVNVPQNGTYSLKLNHKMGTSNAAALRVYITDAETFYGKNVPFGVSMLGEYDASFATSGGTKSDPASVNTPDWNNDRVVVTDKELTAGKYIITFEAYVSNEKSTNRAVIGNFTLEGTPIEEKRAVIYNVAKTMKDNGIFYAQSQVGTTEAEKMTYTMTNGLFEVMDARNTVTIGGNGGTTHNFLKLAMNATVEFKVNVPEDGTYFLKVNHQLSTDGGEVLVYADGEEVGSYNCMSMEEGVPSKFESGDKSVWKNDVLVTEGGIELSAGEHVISYSARNGYGMISYFELANENLVADSISLVYIDKTALEVGGTATISGAVVSSLDGTVKAQGDTNTEYTSSDDSVVTVSGKTIIAVGAGTADIETTVGDVTAKRTITVVDKTATDEVSTVQFMATSTIANNAGVTTDVDGYTVGGTTSDIDPGTTVKVTANPVDGYIFRGWKRGSKDNGVWISTSSTYSFPLLTNTYLTAIYDVDTATDAAVNVEFYNYNGQFLASKAVGENTFGTLATGVNPTLTGYNNYFWTINGTSAVADDTVFEKLTRVVAKFTDTDSFAVKIGDGINGAESTNFAYDTEIELESATGNAGFWKVNGEPVAYGKTYTYTVWSEAEITFEEKENDNKPIISIDDNKTDGARMISYDANGADIVEAGILFGENATISSANSRAVSREAKTNLKGQFTAKPYHSGDVDAATAYLIYNDKGTYRVIYAD